MDKLTPTIFMVKNIVQKNHGTLKVLNWSVDMETYSRQSYGIARYCDKLSVEKEDPNKPFGTDSGMWEIKNFG